MEHRAPHRVQHSDVAVAVYYKAAGCYTDDCMVVVYKADDREVCTDSVDKTSDTDPCRRHTEHCRVECTACDHSATDRRLYMVDKTLHSSPAITTAHLYIHRRRIEVLNSSSLTTERHRNSTVN